MAAGGRGGHLRGRRRATAGFGPPGFEALERTRPDPDGERVVLVHDGARPAVSVAAHRGGRRGGGRARSGDPGHAGRRDPQTDRGRPDRRDRRSLRAWPPPRHRRASGAGILRTALASDEARPGTWTDEAALLEACRIPVHVVPGDAANLKVTVPADLARAASLLAGAGPTRRTGIGHDAHPFGPGEPLRLGGVDIPGAPRLHGHSDGDVVLHALADALLGAAGLGDLGRIFPADASTPAGIDSRALLADVVARLADGGWRPAGVDLTIVAARPRLGAHLEAIRASIAGAPRSPARRRQRQGLERQPRWLRGSRTVDLRRSRSRRSRRADERDPAPRHADRRDAAVGAAARRRRRRVLVRPDRLRPRAHRQLPLVPLRRPARPSPPVARPHRPLGHEHHGHRRQDHPRRGGGRHRHRRSSRTATSRASWPTPTRSG